MDAKGAIIDLKVNGLGINEDIGAAVAIELNGSAFAPMHDFRGNIIGLISDDGDLVELCDYDAFGNQSSIVGINQWRFCSKRKEENLVYFGSRFYDPEFGRWLTPDPLGAFESSNVYLYTLNSPLNRLDAFGLYSTPQKGIYFEPTKTGTMTGNVPYMKSLPITFKCEGILSKTPFAAPVDIVVISGHMYKIHYTPMEKIFNRSNLLDHMHEIASKTEGMIGIITGENGINTSLDEFKENSQAFYKNIFEGTTYVGLYNKTEGFFIDAYRAETERKQRKLTTNALQTGHFIGVIADSLGEIQSKSFWLHVPHSEAGLLFNLGYSTLTTRQKNLLKNQLIAFAVAPAEPISWLACYEANNIYSNFDFLTGPMGKKYKNNPDYNISYMKCESSWKEFSGGFADHAFLGTTYRNATADQIKELREHYGFHSSKTR